MYCINCGNKISENDNFCFKCGAQTKKENINLIKQDDAKTTNNLNIESSNNNPVNKKSHNQNQIIDLKVFSNKCVSCSASIDENSFKVLNNKPYCIKCFNGYSYQFTSSNNESISNSSNNESISKKSGNGWWFMIYTFLGFFLLFSIINFREIGGVFTSSNQNDVQETNKSSYPAGVSSACFCMDALSGGNNYKPTAKQVTQCRTMYKCWGNAQADCYTGSSNVWTRCEN